LFADKLKAGPSYPFDSLAIYMQMMRAKAWPL